MINFIKTNFPFSLNFELCGDWGWTNLGNGNVAEIKVTGPSHQYSTMMRVTIRNKIHGEISERNFLFKDFLTPDMAHCKSVDPDYLAQRGPYIHHTVNPPQWALPPITTAPIVEAVENYIKNFG